MTSADASQNGSQLEEDDPRIQPLSAKHAEELRGTLWPWFASRLFNWMCKLEKFKSHGSDGVAKALAYAKQQIVDLELWSWTDTVSTTSSLFVQICSSLADILIRDSISQER